MSIKHLTYKLILFFAFTANTLFAQDVKVGARIDAAQIMVGDQVRLFLEAQHNPQTSQLQWAVIPDTFNQLEVVEKGKIDTIKNGNLVTYKQRVLITGFDSGMHVVPRFTFNVVPHGGQLYIQQTDSFPILVQTVAVDTSKGFKGIKDIIYVKSSWLDYLWYIIGALVLIILTTVVTIYFIRNKRNKIPVHVPPPPSETSNERALRLLNELEQKKLWENNQPKEYHTELVDILRLYIEERFGVNMMELTSDEILYRVTTHKEMTMHRTLISNILYIADLAKFAKTQPTPQENFSAIEYAKQFVMATQPIVIVSEPQNPVQQ
jgi:hypothetical protein